MTLTYYVVFANDVHDIVCVAVPAPSPDSAVEQVHEALGEHWDTMVFEQAPSLGERITIDHLRDLYGC